MSTPFSNPYDDAVDIKTLLDEITLAYSERRQAVYQPEYITEDDRDIQDKDYWSTFQEWLETNCTSFVDYMNGPLNESETDLLYFTVETWRTLAGLNADGYRRATEWDGVNDPVWSYGYMQSGDIIGPWIFEDLQKAYSALRWNKNLDVVRRSLRSVAVARIGAESCSEHRARTVSLWNAEPWGEYLAELTTVAGIPPRQFGSFYLFDARTEADATDMFSTRFRGKIIFDFDMDLSLEVDLYGLARIWNAIDGGYFYDAGELTSLASLELNVFKFYKTITVASSADFQETYGDVDTNTLDVAGLFCPYPESNTQPQVRLDVMPLLKWDFTNQNADPEE